MRAILFDMDGVLYNSEEPIPEAAETLAWVRSCEIPHLFVTNTTSRGRDALAAKLARFGIPASPSEIVTPCEAAADWLRSRRASNVALFLRPAARPAFEGLDLLPEDAESGADYVVIGDLASAWDFATLNRAFRLLHANPEAALIALGMTLLESSRRDFAGRRSFCRSAGTCHRPKGAGARQAGSGVLPGGRGSVGRSKSQGPDGGRRH
jgi:phospholysine phosphohistidine inorganic pyrophosphate phosphatase